VKNQFDRNKILTHLDVIQDYVQGGTSSPITVEISLTNVCNHDCPQCSGFRAEGGLNSIISTPDAEKIIKDMSECGVKAVTFTGGGDPSMHPDFDYLIKYSRDLGMDVGLITNGLSLKERHLANLIPACNWIRVSWDAATPELHESVHYNGDLKIKMASPDKFWRVVENTKMLTKYRDQIQAQSTVGCAFLVGSHTKHEILGFAQLASTVGVDYCQYRPFHYTQYDAECESLIRESQEKHQTDKMKVLFSEFKFHSMRDKDFERPYDICHGGHFNCHIGANYNIYVCCHLMNRDFACIGNLKEHSFIDLWRSKRRTETVNSINVHECVPLCRNDSANRLLETMKKQNIQHRNFL